MLAVGILAVALLALIGVFTTGLSLLAQSRDSQTATQLARELVETARVTGNVPKAALSFDGSVPTAPVNGFPPLPYPARNVGGQNYVLKVVTLPIRTDLVGVSVEVTWARHRVKTETSFYVP